MNAVGDFITAVPTQWWLALGAVVLGVVVGYVVQLLSRRILVGFGVPEAIETTAFERTAQDLGSSTVAILSRLANLFTVGISVLVALSIADIEYAQPFFDLRGFLPQLFFAVVVLIVGVLVADKVELLVGERLRNVKVPQMDLLPAIARYSVIYLAAIVALSQVGVATRALLVLLGAYFFAVVFLGGIAFKDLLSAGAAGVYLLLNQPYGIGDEVRVGDARGIVQEVDLFVTRVESDDEEYIVPNHRVFERGIVRIRA